MTEKTARLYEHVRRFREQERERPARIEKPLSGQESVWDYPRPPRTEDVAKRVRVEFAGEIIAETGEAKRVLETSGAPAYYIPPRDLRTALLEENPLHQTICEWKGPARYWHLRSGDRLIESAGWSYPDPFPGYEEIRDYVAFYPARVDCFVGDVQAKPQPGGYYGGWVTPEIVGPIKGEPGSEGW